MDFGCFSWNCFPSFLSIGLWTLGLESMTLNLINLYMTMERYTQTSSSRCASGRSILLDIDDALERLSNHSSPINRMHVTVKRSSTAIPEMAPNSVYSQLGVISPFPVRGLPLPVLQGKFVSSKSKTLSAMNHVTPGRLQRSKTILSTPCRHCDACTVKHLRNFNKVSYRHFLMWFTVVFEEQLSHC